MAEQNVDQQFVETVVKALLDHPDEVKTERTVDEMGVLITLFINQADMGQIIGRSGRTARAIRTLLRVVGAKNHARVNLKIHEPEGSRPPRPAMGRDDRDRRYGYAAPSANSDDADAEVDDLRL
ncbi:MAG: KH domain-containing protein [Candidatus Jacksonbacteria bacterium]